VDAQETNAHYRSDHPEHAAMVALLNAGPALLADAEALADFAALAREIRATAGDGDNIAVSGETMRGWAAELERATNG
jgi:hypothetical protein